MAFSSWRTFVTGETVTAAHLNQEIRDNGEALFPDGITGVSWTPTLQGVSSDYFLKSQSGRRWRVGAMQFGWARFIMGDVGAGVGPDGSGTMFVTLPASSSGIDASTAAFSGQVIGDFHCKDGSTAANNRGGTVGLRSSSPTHAHFFTADGSTLNESTPFTWVEDDILTIEVRYPIA